MSRDPFSQDTAGGLDALDRSGGGSSRCQIGAPSRSRASRNSAPEIHRNADESDAREPHPVRDERGNSPLAYYVRDRAYLLTVSQLHSLKEIGKFRVISVSDLATYSYHGYREQIEKDIRGLARHSLLRDSTLEISQKRTIRVVTLTKDGHRLLTETNQLPEDQSIYHGFKKPREVRHDADLYLLYQREAARIERGGGRPVRVLLDYELKRNLNRDLALLGPAKDDPATKAAVAKRHQLLVVNGKIPVPDLRVEYASSELELRHVDLELATSNYGPRAMAQKASAGFSLYGRSEDASRLRRILDEHGITARIHTL